MTPADRTIVVLSPKGGTGKTTVATNLAVALGHRRPGEVAIVNLDLAFGDVASALLLDARPGLFEVASGATPRVYDRVLHVVGAPDTAAPVVPNGAEVRAALDAVGRRYTTLVIDTGAGFDDATLAAARAATDIVLVGSMDVPTLLGLRKVLRWLDALGVDGAERHLVLNRCDATVGLEIDDVTATTGLPIAVAIPSSAVVTRSVNEGVPVVHGGVPSAAADSFRQLAARLAPLRRPWQPSKAASAARAASGVDGTLPADPFATSTR